MVCLNGLSTTLTIDMGFGVHTLRWQLNQVPVAVAGLKYGNGFAVVVVEIDVAIAATAVVLAFSLCEMF